MINHQSSITSHLFFLTTLSSLPPWHAFLFRHSVITFFSTIGDQFFLNMHATSGQQAGNLRTSSKTLGEDWKPSGTLGKPSVNVGNCWKPSFWHIFYTFSSRNRSGIGFMSSRIAGNDRLDLGNSKIEVLAKKSKKNKGKTKIVWLWPLAWPRRAREA